MSFAAVFDLFMSMTTLFAQAGQDVIGTAIVLLAKSFAYYLLRPTLCGGWKLQFSHRLVFHPGWITARWRVTCIALTSMAARASIDNDDDRLHSSMIRLNLEDFEIQSVKGANGSVMRMAVLENGREKEDKPWKKKVWIVEGF